MIPLSIKTIVAVTGGAYHGAPELLSLSVPDIVIDSRKCAGGALYVPIHGLRFDGHDFIPAAFTGGAAFTLAERPVEGYPYILVPDALAALQALAEFYMRQFPDLPVIGITGSVGKTSTKEMLYSVLSKKYRVHKNIGNLNNQTGLPQTIFTLDHSYDLSVMELGTNHFGEIERLSYMAKPSVCLFTNIGVSHIEYFGSREGILKGKMEMLAHAKPGYRVIVNGDDDLLENIPGALKFGLSQANDIYAENLEDLGLAGLCFTAVCRGERQSITIHSPGKHLVYNALAAIAVGGLFDMSLTEMKGGIEAYAPEHGRMDMIRTDRFTIIDDTYNSILASAISALDALSDAATRRVAILGDMRELGNEGPALHEKVGAYAGKLQIDVVIAVGEYAAIVANAAKSAGAKQVLALKNRDALEAALPELLNAGDTVLVKASRGLEFEHTVEFLKKIS